MLPGPILDLLVPSALVVRCHAPPVPRQRGGETATYPGSSRDLFAVKRGQAVGFVVELAPRALGQPAERLDAQPALVVPPRPRDLTVDQEGGHGVRRLRVEHSRSIFLRKDLGPAGVRQERGVPRRQEPDGRRGLPVGQGGPREVEQLAAALVAEPAKRQPAYHRTEYRRREPGPGGQV